MVRTFIAIDLPPEVTDRVPPCQEILKRSAARLTLVDPRNIHLTLKFLGEVEESQLAPIGDALRSLRSYPFPMALNGVAGNPPRTPRVIWCNVQDAGQSARLHDRVEEVLAPLGFPREARPFTPHVTVARVKQFDPSLLPQVRAVAQTTFGTCTVSGFSFKKSTLTPRGPLYENLLEVRW
jgi:RNA 2',3'-cyclic 3'-phosphodiesterase